jgi:hypothetical protein
MAGDACETCCSDHHPQGSQENDDAFYGCICDPTRCATQCAQTDCSDADDAGSSVKGDPCDTCQNQYFLDDGGGACGVIVSQQCTSADCKAYAACSDNCND